MRKTFIARRENQPGEAWLARFIAGREEAERWYRGQGSSTLPSAAKCRSALLRHMPELIPQYDRACDLVGDDPSAHRMLSHYRPPPVESGCSHAIWHGEDGPALVRNYDFPLDVVSDGLESTSWLGPEVIGKAQRPWGGLLDGMNEDGLVASLSFGGSPARGEGFSIILIVRYVLETCRNVEEAIVALSRIPVALSQNVSLLDRSGDAATVFIGPDRSPAVSKVPIITNHQEIVVCPEIAAVNRTVERWQAIGRALADPAMTLPALIDRFLEPPLYSREAQCPTAYTAVYRPALASVDYLWPGKVWSQAIGCFEPGEYVHDYGELIRSSAPVGDLRCR